MEQAPEKERVPQKGRALGMVMMEWAPAMGPVTEQMLRVKQAPVVTVTEKITVKKQTLKAERILETEKPMTGRIQATERILETK